MDLNLSLNLFRGKLLKILGLKELASKAEYFPVDLKMSSHEVWLLLFVAILN